MDPTSSHADEALVRIWAALHADLRPGLTVADAVYLQRVLLDLDDDLLARLLAVKLSRATRLPLHGASTTVRAGSHARFTLDGRENHATLVHGRGGGPGALGVVSRYGAALFGLGRGDAILWPNEDCRLVEIHVLDVVRHERPTWNAASSSRPKGLPCASG